MIAPSKGKVSVTEVLSCKTQRKLELFVIKERVMLIQNPSLHKLRISKKQSKIYTNSKNNMPHSDWKRIDARNSIWGDSTNDSNILFPVLG